MSLDWEETAIEVQAKATCTDLDPLCERTSRPIPPAERGVGLIGQL
jgi:hypothetical protein